MWCNVLPSPLMLQGAVRYPATPATMFLPVAGTGLAVGARPVLLPTSGSAGR